MLQSLIEQVERLRNHPMGLESLAKKDADEKSYLEEALDEHILLLHKADKDVGEDRRRQRSYYDSMKVQMQYFEELASMSDERLGLKLKEELNRMEDHEYQPSVRLLNVIAGRLV